MSISIGFSPNKIQSLFGYNHLINISLSDLPSKDPLEPGLSDQNPGCSPNDLEIKYSDPCLVLFYHVHHDSELLDPWFKTTSMSVGPWFCQCRIEDESFTFIYKDKSYHINHKENTLTEPILVGFYEGKVVSLYQGYPDFSKIMNKNIKVMAKSGLIDSNNRDNIHNILNIPPIS